MSDTAPQGDPAEPGSAADLRSNFETQLFQRDVELAFTRAGIDTTKPAAQAMVEKYAQANKGDKAALTADKLLEVAKEWGVVEVPKPADAEPPAATAETPAPAADPTTAAEAEAHRTADDLANSGETPDPDGSTANPAEVGLAMAQKKLAEGGTEAEAAAEYFDRVVDAGGKGDSRVTNVEVPNIQPAHAG